MKYYTLRELLHRERYPFVIEGDKNTLQALLDTLRENGLEPLKVRDLR